MSDHQQIQKSKKPEPSSQRRAPPANWTYVSDHAAIIQRTRINPKSLTPADVLQLQRTIGNRAVGRLLSEIRNPSMVQQAIVQRQETPEEEEPLQGKMIETIQRQEIPEEEEPLQTKKENNTGMPDNLKAGVENLSIIDMSGVRVHYNSDKPAKVGALAYTQGTNIHVASGQERHLPHEAWHVVQQMQGRVKPMIQLKGGVQVNDDEVLEHEADAMGAKAWQYKTDESSVKSSTGLQRSNENIVQRYITDLTGQKLPFNDVWVKIGKDAAGTKYESKLNYYINSPNGYILQEVVDSITTDTDALARFLPSQPSSELIKFIQDVWGRKNEIEKFSCIKKRLDYIYTQAYAKNGGAKVPPPHNFHIIRRLVHFARGKNAHLQFGVPIPPDNNMVEDIQTLYKMTFDNPLEVQRAVYNGLATGYYYFLINSGVTPNARIILNVSPLEVPNVLEDLYTIVSGSPFVQGMKAAGPITAANKLDSIIIYLYKGEGYQNLLKKIIQRGYQTVDLLPGLVQKTGAHGIGIADEPPAVLGTNISFGQKRVILAYMALCRSQSLESFQGLTAFYFNTAGINIGSPSEEVPVPEDRAIIKELSDLLAIMNAK